MRAETEELLDSRRNSVLGADIMRTITGHARLAGVIGWPVAHSRSPRLHGFWLDRMGIDGAYIPMPVAPGQFATAIRGLQAAGFRGCNVTIPHKLDAFALCDVVDPTAARAGALNTLVFDEGRIIGSNTDIPGFIANLRAHGIDPAAGPALVVGAGGAGRSVAAGLQALGVAVTIVNRHRDRAEALAAALPPQAGHPPIAVLDWAALDDALADHALLANTTSLGMKGQPALLPDLARGGSQLVVADIVYVPLRTPLLAAAEALGLRAVGGLGMLLHQAVPGFTAWFGVTPTVDQDLYNFVAADLLPAG